MLYEWGHCIVQDSRAVNCEIGNNIIEQYHGDGIAKNFLNNAGIDLSGFDKEVLRQVENRVL